MSCVGGLFRAVGNSDFNAAVVLSGLASQPYVWPTYWPIMELARRVSSTTEYADRKQVNAQD